jgi:aminopeptidase N
VAGDLTRAEAAQRAASLVVDSYSIAVDVTSDGDVFRGVTTVCFGAATSDTFLDLCCAAIHSAKLNGVDLEPLRYDAAAGRLLLTGLVAENELTVDADFSYKSDGAGLHRFVDRADGQTYLHTNFEPADAHQVFACFDQPDLKAVITWAVTAPAGWTVVSNSPVREVADAGGARTWRFEPTPRIPPYITAFAAGPFHEVHDEHVGVPLALYCRQAMSEQLDAAAVLQTCKDGLDFFTDALGPYPFSKYSHVFVLEFASGGAMENPGCVILSEEGHIFGSRVPESAYERRAETILHEMAHMWFGNLVTMRWWDDLWLNEAFATYLAVLALAEGASPYSGWVGFANRTKAWAHQQDQLSSAHPISADVNSIANVRNNFDGITYAKGAAVLRQLAAWVGQEAFLAGLREYFAVHAWCNTSREDLLAALEKSSGRDLSSWSAEWLESAGGNVLRPSFTLDAAGRFCSFAIVQEGSGCNPTLRSHRVAVGFYRRTPAGIVRDRRIELDVVGPRTAVPEVVGLGMPDLVLVNDDDLTYAKMRLDAGSLHTLINGITEITDPLAVALCWSAAWDMTRDAEMAAGDYVRLVAHGAGAIGDPVVLETVLHQARIAMLRYSCESHREADRALLAQRLRGHLAAAPPASDEQLIYLSALAECIAGTEDAAVVREVLDGHTDLQGLVVDADCRWKLLLGLVASGAAGESEIAAELALDGTAVGEQRAARCRAAIPTPEAKAAAWELLTGGRERSGAILVATMLGFAEPSHGRLHAPFVERYFSVIDEIWNSYHSELATGFVVGAYPSAVVAPETLAASEAYLARGTSPLPLARLVREGMDGVERALKARHHDAGSRS